MDFGNRNGMGEVENCGFEQVLSFELEFIEDLHDVIDMHLYRFLTRERSKSLKGRKHVYQYLIKTSSGSKVTTLL